MDKDRFYEIIAGEVDLSGYESRMGEFDDVVQLLLEHKTSDSEDTEKLARILAFSCLGSNHLWQDMKLNDRNELSELLETHFKPLFEKNYKDMKWKKFFYRQICGWEGFSSCRSPSCDICVDYDECFGPEIVFGVSSNRIG